VTPSVAAPGDTNPSDATEGSITQPRIDMFQLLKSQSEQIRYFLVLHFRRHIVQAELSSASGEMESGRKKGDCTAAKFKASTSVWRPTECDRIIATE